MKPIEFPESNVVMGKGQDEYLDLPAHREEVGELARTISCWSLSWRERLQVLMGKRVWLSVLTLGQPLQPVMLDVGPPEELGRWGGTQ